MATGTKRKKISEKSFDNCIVVDKDGNVKFNALQQDDMVIRRIYDDGTISLTSFYTGKHIVPPYRLDNAGEMVLVEDWED